MVDYRDDPAVYVFGDSAPALARMSASAAAAGVRIVSALPVGTAPEPSTLLPGAALLIELDDEAAAAAGIPLLDWALTEAEAAARRSVVSTSQGLIDLVAARAWHADIAHLCEANDDERVLAIARACERPAAQLQDSRRERDFPIMRPLPDPGVAAQGASSARDDAAFIRTLLRTRRLRAHYFRADLFADPAWDMLLDLMAARLEGKPVAVSSLCIAAAVPPTTALRWIGVLTENGLVVRVADRNDGRRVYVELAEQTARTLGAWLQEARRMLREAP